MPSDQSQPPSARADPDSSEHAFGDTKLGPQAVVRLRAAFERSRNPMLLADDQRRWVTANGAACELFGIQSEEVPWCTMDDFTPPGESRRLEEQWGAFLASGAAEGWYQLYVPQHGTLPVEFSATANVLPARHLSVFIPPEGSSTEQAEASLARAEGWSPAVGEAGGRLELTEREREVITLIAAGAQGRDIAKRLVLAPETVKSHADNAMSKLGARTRAHAVGIALVTGQITWEM